jgi:hypothetical protein
MYVLLVIHSFVVLLNGFFFFRAKFYSDWEKREGREAWVCAVWVRSYNIWMNSVSKVLLLVA